MKQWLIVSSGAGPAEVCLFVKLLAARLAELCRRHGFPPTSVASVGPDDAPRSITLEVDGSLAPRLASELGVHALVARSPSRGRQARKRWFASVRMVEALTEDGLTPDELDPREVEVTACRAGGPGGQHVNKTSTAIRVCHVPTGLRVRVDEQRSQHANRVMALQRLRDELRRRKETAMQTQRTAARHGHYQLERGNPVRVYRLGRRGQLETVDGAAP